MSIEDIDPKAWEQIGNFIATHGYYNLSFSIEYSSVIDWVVEFVPRRNHPLAREYNGPWQRNAGSPTKAIKDAMELFERMINEEK